MWSPRAVALFRHALAVFGLLALALAPTPAAALLAPTTTTVTASANPIPSGSPVTFTIAVTSGAGTPDGTVLILADVLSLGIVTLDGTGHATFTTSTLPIGVHAIVAVYVGNLNFATSTSISLNVNVTLAACTISVAASVNPLIFGTSVNLTATVSGSGPTPTGNVTLKSGLTVLGNVALNGSGQGVLSTNALLVGLLSIGADYSGDANYLPCTAPILIVTVNKSSSTTTVNSSSNPSVAGAPVTFSATVSGSGGTPTGNVTFKDGVAVIGTGTLNGSGVATMVAASLSSGTHSITATYIGDTNFTGSTSPALSQAVNATAGSTASTTSLTATPNPAAAGAAVTFTATVTGAGGTPSGGVTFKDGATTVGTGTLNGGGQAVLVTSSLLSGTHSITAVYGGDVTFAASTSPALAFQVNTGGSAGTGTATTTTLATSVNPGVAGQPVTFTAAVSASAGSPTGTVTFRDNGGTIGTASLAGGSAILTMSSLAVGSHSITATYGGDTTFASSVSSRLAQSISAPPDSLKLRSLQVVATRIAAQNSGQAISGAIDAAIDEGFSDGDQMLAPSDTGLRLSSLGYEMQNNGRRMPRPDWIVWSDLRHTTLTADATRQDISGNQGNALAGVTYRVMPDLLVGIFGGYESFNYDVASLNGHLRGDGWTVGGYTGWRVLPGIRFDAGVAQSGIGYQGVAGSAAGSFGGSRTLFTSGLTGLYRFLPGFEVEPSARVYALWENENAYTDSLGTQQSDRSFSTGRASIGAKVTYRWAVSGTTAVAPFAGVYADNYFNKDDAGIGSIPAVMQGSSARLIGGIGVVTDYGLKFSSAAELGGLGGNFTSWTFRARGAVPF